jgi:hypothetical protein
MIIKISTQSEQALLVMPLIRLIGTDTFYESIYYGNIIDCDGYDDFIFDIQTLLFYRSADFNMDFVCQLQHGDAADGSDMADVSGQYITITQGDTHGKLSVDINTYAIKRYVRMKYTPSFTKKILSANGTPLPSIAAHASYELKRDAQNYADCNPAMAIGAILLDDISSQTAAIDWDSIHAAAITCYNESLGVSFVMDSQRSGSQWIEDILTAIDGYMTQDLTTGKVGIGLIRDDYDTDTIGSITSDHYKGLEYGRQAWEDLEATYVSVSFTDRKLWDSSNLTAINPGAEKVLGYRRAKTYDFSMITNETSGTVVLKRLMVKTTYPLAPLKFTISRKDFPTIRQGDVYYFSSTELGITNMVIRILSVNGWYSEKNEVEVSAIEDIFSVGNIGIEVPQNNIHTPQEWQIGAIKLLENH